MRRIGDNQVKIPVVQDHPYRNPINAGRLHGDMGAALLAQPAQQGLQIISGGRERPTFPLHLATGVDTHAGDDRRLVHIKAGNPFVHDFHHTSPSWCRRRGSPRQRSLRSVLRGKALGASGGHPGIPGPTRNRARAHQGVIDLDAGSALS